MKDKLFTLLIVIAVIFFMIAANSCAPVPRAVVVAPPTKAEPVAPVAAKVKTQVVVVKEQNTEIQLGLTKAIAEADRLAKQKSATEAELTALWQTLSTTKLTVEDQWQQLTEADKTIDELNIKANASDTEVGELRKSFDRANTLLDEAKKYEAYAAPKVAVYEWISSRLMWLLIFVAVAGILFLLVKFAPNIRSAISPL